MPPVLKARPVLVMGAHVQLVPARAGSRSGTRVGREGRSAPHDPGGAAAVLPCSTNQPTPPTDSPIVQQLHIAGLQLPLQVQVWLIRNVGHGLECLQDRTPRAGSAGVAGTSAGGWGGAGGTSVQRPACPCVPNHLQHLRREARRTGVALRGREERRRQRGQQEQRSPPGRSGPSLPAPPSSCAGCRSRRSGLCRMRRRGAACEVQGM